MSYLPLFFDGSVRHLAIRLAAEHDATVDLVDRHDGARGHTDGCGRMPSLKERFTAYRRNWFFSLGVSAAGSLAGLSAVTDSQANKRSWVLSLESFRLSHADQMARLQTYFGGTFLPYLAQVHRGPKMFLEAIVAPHTPQALVVTAFPSFEEMIEIRNKVAAHPRIQRARADLKSGESQILVTTADFF